MNNAGDVRVKYLQDLTEDELDWTFKTNVTSVVFLTQRAMPHLIETRGHFLYALALLKQSLGFRRYD